MVHNENAEWEEFSALLDDVVPDTSESAQSGQSDAQNDSQAYAQAQNELQSSDTDEDDSDLDEVDVDQFAMEPRTEMETESGTTAQNHEPTQETLATGPVVAEAPVELSSGSPSTATIQSAAPQSEAAANRARATEKGYLARRRAARRSTSLQTAKKEAASQAGSMTPQAPSIVATSPATLPPPPPLPVGPTGLRQLWEETLTLGLPRVKAEYRVTLPPARPASAPVVGAASAGPVPSVAARHQSAPVASTSRRKRSRDGEDRGERVVRKRAKANNSTAQSQQPRQPSSSSSVCAPRPQWIPYTAQQPEKSRQWEHVSASLPSGRPVQTQQQNVSGHKEQQVQHVTPPPLVAPPSTSTSQAAMQMSSTARYISVPGRQAAYAVAPQHSSDRSMQPMPVAGPSRCAYEQEQGDSGLQHPRNRAQTYAMPEQNDQAAVPRTFARAAPSTSRGTGQSTIVPQQPLRATPEAGPSRGAYQQSYNRAGVQHPYNQSASPQSYMMPVPSGWNDPAAVPRTFAHAQSSTRQTERHSYLGAQGAPAAYAARPQQQIERPVPLVHGGEWASGPEQLPSVDGTGSQPVYDQPYAPPMPMSAPAGWNSSAQLQTMSMSAGETVPAYLTMYAPPNYPPPGWNPQAPVYEQEPSAQSFSSGQRSMSSAYGYGYDF